MGRPAECQCHGFVELTDDIQQILIQERELLKSTVKADAFCLGNELLGLLGQSTLHTWDIGILMLL